MVPIHFTFTFRLSTTFASIIRPNNKLFDVHAPSAYFIFNAYRFPIVVYRKDKSHRLTFISAFPKSTTLIRRQPIDRSVEVFRVVAGGGGGVRRVPLCAGS